MSFENEQSTGEPPSIVNESKQEALEQATPTLSTESSPDTECELYVIEVINIGILHTIYKYFKTLGYNTCDNQWDFTLHKK